MIDYEPIGGSGGFSWVEKEEAWKSFSAFSLFRISPENSLSISLEVLVALAGLTDPRESRKSLLLFPPVFGLSVDEFKLPFCEVDRLAKSLVAEDVGLMFSVEFGLLFSSVFAIYSTGVSFLSFGLIP